MLEAKSRLTPILLILVFKHNYSYLKQNKTPFFPRGNLKFMPENIDKTKIWSFEKMNQSNELLARITKNKNK